MFCQRGDGLLAEYRHAALQRAEARDVALLAGGTPGLGENDKLLMAKQLYNDAFVAWVTHRGLCISCRSRAVKEDREQFKSI